MAFVDEATLVTIVLLETGRKGDGFLDSITVLRILTEPVRNGAKKRVRTWQTEHPDVPASICNSCSLWWILGLPGPGGICNPS